MFYYHSLCLFLATFAWLLSFPKICKASTPETSCKTSHLWISAPTALVDEPIEIEIRGLHPFQEIQLIAEVTDEAGELWGSNAKFQANQEGNVSLGLQAPFEGTYEDIDSMGLFWSMQPASKKHLSFIASMNPIKFFVHLIVDGKKIDTAMITRLWSKSKIEKIIVREEGLVGTLFLPADSTPAPVIITLNGSGGGVTENRAALLAEHGFAVFTLGYFGMDGLPATLEHIPIEYFEKAFHWIKNHSDLDGSKIGLMGGSKGGELVLLLGSLFPDDFKAITAVVPNCAIFPGCAEGIPGPAWTHHGIPLEPIGHMNHVDPKEGLDAMHAIWLTPYFLEGIKNNPELFRSAAISVEKIKCPILLVSGGDDQMWPSAFFSEQIVNRLQENNANTCCHINYPKAGHQLGLPFLPSPSTTFWHPVTKRWYFMGGNAKENELAKRDYWMKMIQFFKEHLIDNTK